MLLVSENAGWESEVCKKKALIFSNDMHFRFLVILVGVFPGFSCKFSGFSVVGRFCPSSLLVCSVVGRYCPSSLLYWKHVLR